MKESQETESFRLFLKVEDACLLIRGTPDPEAVVASNRNTCYAM